MDITEQILYEDYIIETKKTQYTFEIWFKVISAVLMQCVKQFIYENAVFVFPRRMGFVSLVKTKSRNSCQGLTAEDRKLTKPVKDLLHLKLNFDTFGYMFRTKWDRRNQYTSLRNRDYYIFRWQKEIKTMIHKHIVKTHKDRSVVMMDTPLHRL